MNKAPGSMLSLTTADKAIIITKNISHHVETSAPYGLPFRTSWGIDPLGHMVGRQSTW